MVSETQKTAESAPEKQPSQQSTEASTSTPKMFTEEEHQKLLTDALNAARGEEGRKHKQALAAAEKRASDAAQASLASIQRENKELQEALDDLAKDDEDKTRLVELLRKNKAKEDSLEAKVKALEPKIAKAEDYELTELCNDVAKEYEGADAARLKRIASRTKFSEDEDKAEQIRSLAEDIWTKKSETPAPQKKEEPRKMDSGINSGKVGLTAEDVMKMSPEEKNRRYKEIAAIPF